MSHSMHNNPGSVVTDTGVVEWIPAAAMKSANEPAPDCQRMDRPIIHIFATQFHGDHWLANQALVETYPDALTIHPPGLIALTRGQNEPIWCMTVIIFVLWLLHS